MKRCGSLFLLLCLYGAIFFCSCISYTVGININSLRLLRDKYPTLTIRTEWESYGAYYEIDEFYLEAPYQQFIDPFITGTTYSSAASKYVISNRIRILTKEGVRCGTVRLPRYNGSIKAFKPRMFDEKGIEQRLNCAAMESEFRKTGTVVFPNVTPGCVIETYIVLFSSEPITVFEYWFTRAIPVYKAKFTFSFPYKFEYAFKEYGNCPPGLVDQSPDNDQFSVHTWTCENILPRSSGDRRPRADITEDRVGIAMRYGFNQSVFSSWSMLAEKINGRYFQASSFSADVVAPLADSLARGSVSSYGKADKVVAWVQDNISLEYDATVRDYDPEASFQKRKASIWEKAFICARMLSAAGVAADILLTRSHPFGGFDESFVTPASLQTPLIMVTVKDTVRCAFPYVRGYALGEYPESYFGLKGLQMSKGAVVALPAPSLDQSYCDFKFALAYAGDTLSNVCDVEYAGPIAWEMRSRMLLQQAADIKEGFQRMLSSFDRANKLNTCAVFGLNDRGTPLRAKLTFNNQNQITVRKGVTYVSLSHLYYSYAEESDSTKVSPFNFEGKVLIRESMQFQKPAGKTTVLNLSCAPVKNELFSSFCTTSETPQYCKSSRTITIRRSEVPPNKLYALSRNANILNQIKESSVVIK